LFWGTSQRGNLRSKVRFVELVSWRIFFYSLSFYAFYIYNYEIMIWISELYFSFKSWDFTFFDDFYFLFIVVLIFIMDLSALYKLLKFNLKAYLIASRCAETLLKTVEFTLPLSIFLTIEMLSLTIYNPIC
jgi:hypothetical protein